MKTNNFLSKPVLSENLESPAQQQSHETYLLPRNCWLKIRSLQCRPSILDKNSKIRIRISVPNSARVVKTSQIQFDDAFLSSLQETQNKAGFSEIKMNVTVLLEYKHDVRIGHQNNLDLDVESISPIFSRSKSIGSASIDLSQVIQKPIQSMISFRKDNDTTFSANVQIYSLVLSKTSPPAQFTDTLVNFNGSDSETDSEAVPVITAHFEQTVSKLLKSKVLMIIDNRTPQGQTLLQGASLNDFVLPITDLQVIRMIFNIASQEFIPSSTNPFRFIIAGDDNFLCIVLKDFLTMRDKGVLATGTFSFLHIPLFEQKSQFARQISSTLLALQLNNPSQQPVPAPAINQDSSSSDDDSDSNSGDNSNQSKSIANSYSSHFLVSDWFNVFLEDSHVQNASSVINSELQYLIQTPLTPVPIFIVDVMITTTSDQFLIPMLLMIEIGKLKSDEEKKGSKDKSSNAIQLKANVFTKDGSKNVNLKFTYLVVSSNFDSSLKATWWQVQNPSSNAKKQTKKDLTKIVFNAGKSHKDALTVRIDEDEYKDVITMTITPRDPSSALQINVPSSTRK